MGGQWIFALHFWCFVLFLRVLWLRGGVTWNNSVPTLFRQGVGDVIEQVVFRFLQFRRIIGMVLFVNTTMMKYFDNLSYEGCVLLGHIVFSSASFSPLLWWMAHVVIQNLQV
jgi:hypothetical protein